MQVIIIFYEKLIICYNRWYESGERMKKKYTKIDNIPAIIWGEDSSKIFIAIHGNQSNKEDVVL